MQSTTIRQASLALTPISTGVQPTPDGAPQVNPYSSPFASPLPGPPSGNTSPTLVTALQRRVRELDDENKRLNSENIKLSGQYTQLKERWRAVKESAKKRRTMKEAQNPAVTEGLRGMSIKEEDEEELRDSGMQRPPGSSLGRK